MRGTIYLFLLVATQVFSADWYVSPTGNGDGTITSPWTIAFAFTNTTGIAAGDTVWLRSGNYSAYSAVWPYILQCTLQGTDGSPITIRQYPGERAILDGGVNCGVKDYLILRDFEVTCTRARTNTYEVRPAGIVSGGIHNKLINLVLHDTGHPCIQGVAGEIYGCVIWGAGLYEYGTGSYTLTNTWTRGAGMYLQNSGTNVVYVTDNISSRNFTGGIKSYAENGYVNNFNCQWNIVFKNNGEGIYCDCLFNSITNYTACNNFAYRSGIMANGYFASDALNFHYGLTYSNNYIVGSPDTGGIALGINRWEDMVVTSNMVITTSTTNEWSAGSGISASVYGQPGGAGGRFLQLWPGTNITSYTLDGNAYYGGVEQNGGWDGGLFFRTYQPFIYRTTAWAEDGTNGSLSFVVWTNIHGYDLNSTYTTNLPTVNTVSLRTNKYEVGRANLVVFNWESNSVVNVDVSGLGYTQGQRFEVRDAQNYLGTPVLTTNYNAATPTIRIPLTETNITSVFGYIAGKFTFDPNIHTAPLFNAFVLMGANTTHTANITTLSVGTIQMAP
jgi:hypothetical protein